MTINISKEESTGLYGISVYGITSADEMGALVAAESSLRGLLDALNGRSGGFSVPYKVAVHGTTATLGEAVNNGVV